MNFSEIADAVLRTPGIERGFFQHYIGLHLNPKSVRNQGGGYQSSHNFDTHFRVVLYMDRQFQAEPAPGGVKGKFVEIEHPDLITAIHAAFAALDLKVPPSIPKPPKPTKK